MEEAYIEYLEVTVEAAKKMRGRGKVTLMVIKTKVEPKKNA